MSTEGWPAEGEKVRIVAPSGHPLRGATGAVVRILSADELWRMQPLTMLGEPLAWLGGQVLVSLDEPRPRDHKDRPWTPVVTVRRADLSPWSASPA